MSVICDRKQLQCYNYTVSNTLWNIIRHKYSSKVKICWFALELLKIFNGAKVKQHFFLYILSATRQAIQTFPIFNCKLARFIKDIRCN